MSPKTIGTDLPAVLQEFASRYPDVWESYNSLGKACGEAGPLDGKTQHLVKLAIAVGAGRQGAVHSHARRALKVGLSPDALLQITILAITTIGWSGGFAATTWVQDEIDRSNASSSKDA